MWRCEIRQVEANASDKIVAFIVCLDEESIGSHKPTKKTQCQTSRDHNIQEGSQFLGRDAVWLL
jgi:hypothetical protein